MTIHIFIETAIDHKDWPAEGFQSLEDWRLSRIERIMRDTKKQLDLNVLPEGVTCKWEIE